MMWQRKKAHYSCLQSNLQKVEGYPLVFNSNRDKQARDWHITGQGIGDVGEDGLYHLTVKNEPANLFNATTGRTVQDLGDFSNTAKRSFTGNGIYLGLTSSNYYVPTNIANYSIDSDGSVSLTRTSGSSPGYGIGFDFTVKPGEVYYISHNATSDNTLRPIIYSFYDNEGTVLSNSFSQTNSNHIITVPDNAYWLIIICDVWPPATQTYSDIMLTRIDNADFEPYRVPIVKEVVLDEPINGTVTYKGNVLPALQVFEGTNIVTVEAKTEPTNMSIKY